MLAQVGPQARHRLLHAIAAAFTGAVEEQHYRRLAAAEAGGGHEHLVAVGLAIQRDLARDEFTGRIHGGRCGAGGHGAQQQGKQGEQ